MKRFIKKLVVLIITLCVTSTSLIGCDITLGGEKKPLLTFSLTQSDVTQYETTVSNSKNGILNSNSLLDAQYYVQNLISGLNYIAEQRYIAQIIYFENTLDETNKQNYDFATTAYNTARTGYISVFKALYKSNSKLKDDIFSGMTDEEIKNLFGTDDKVDELNNKTNDLLNEYYALTDENFEEETGKIYAQMVSAYNEIATLSGYDNYYEYASSYVYERDYGKISINNLTNYVKNYFIPLYTELYNDFTIAVNGLNIQQRQAVSSIMYSTFDELSVNYVTNYINSVPSSMKSGMQDMFKTKHYVVAKNDNAREGAFTVTLPYSNVPFCYFGNGYSDSFTMVHEIGHYYANLNNTDVNIPLDVAEIHSQANELLFLCYLKQTLDYKVYEVVELATVIDMLSTAIVSVLMNEFEMQVFALNDVSAYTSNDFDAIMNKVCAEFGNEFITNYLTSNINNYWKRAIVQSPVYYISYAVSGISALGLYCEAIADNGYNKAVNKYINLCENADLSAGLLSVLDDVDMLSPFTENTYITLTKTLTATDANLLFAA